MYGRGTRRWYGRINCGLVVHSFSLVQHSWFLKAGMRKEGLGGGAWPPRQAGLDVARVDSQALSSSSTKASLARTRRFGILAQGEPEGRIGRLHGSHDARAPPGRDPHLAAVADLMPLRDVPPMTS